MRKFEVGKTYKAKMMSRWEIEELLGTKLTDEQWEENKKAFNEYNKEYHFDSEDSDLEE